MVSHCAVERIVLHALLRNASGQRPSGKKPSRVGTISLSHQGRRLDRPLQESAAPGLHETTLPG